MFENDKKIQFVKDTLGSRQDYHEIIANHSFTNPEKDILLQASVNIHRAKINKSLMDEAYNILVSKSIRSTTKNKNFTMDISFLKYLLLAGFLLIVYYLVALKEPQETKKEEAKVVVVKFGDIAGQGFLRTKGGLVRTCAGSSVYLEKSNPNGFVVLSEALLAKKEKLSIAESNLFSKKFSLDVAKGQLEVYLKVTNPTLIEVVKDTVRNYKNKIIVLEKDIPRIKNDIIEKKKEVLKYELKVKNSIKNSVLQTMCDAQGNYGFLKVEVGKYYISTVVQWYVGDEKQGGIVSKTITVKEGENKIMITE